MRPPQLSHEQLAPIQQARAAAAENEGSMPPPPPPTTQGGRFKPANRQVHAQADQRMQATRSHVPEAQNPTQQPRMQRTSVNKGPPPTPQRPFSRVLQTPSRLSAQNMSFDADSTLAQTSTALQSNRFIPTSSHGRPTGPTMASTSSTKLPASNFSTSKSSGGQRMPFMPGNSSGFG